MAETGWTLGSTATTNGGADFAWSNAVNVQTDNTSYAEATSGGREESDRLKVVDFAFGTDPTGTIDGIEARIRWKSEGAAFAQTNVRLIKGGTVTGSNKSTGATIPSSNQTVDFGSPADLWGLTWTPADVTASSFGVAFQAEDEDRGSDYIRVEAIWINVSYTPSPSGPSGEDLARGMFANVPI